MTKTISHSASPVGASPVGASPVGASPVGATHHQGRSKTSTRNGKREQGSHQGRPDRHKTGPQGYRALQGRVLAGYGQQEQGKSTLSRRRPSPQRHHRTSPSRPVIRHRPTPRIPPDLLLGTLQKLRPSLRRPCQIAGRIAKQMPPNIQAKHPADVRTRAMRPRAGPPPILRLLRHPSPHRVVLQIPQNSLKPMPSKNIASKRGVLHEPGCNVKSNRIGP